MWLFTVPSGKFSTLAICVWVRSSWKASSEDPLLRLAEPGELVSDEHPVGDAVRRPLDEFGADQRRGCRPEPRVPGACRPAVRDDVPGDAEQPAGETAVRGAIVLAALPGADEDDLGDVLRVGRDAERPQCHRVDER